MTTELAPWSQLLEVAKRDPGLQTAREALTAKAREVAQSPIVRRVYHLDDVGKYRTWLDGRSRALEPETKEIFALAMSDTGTCNIAAAELPLLAAAYRLTGEDAFRARAAEQLDEMTTWSPLQRPGWTCFQPGNRLPPDGKDGNWLATGTGVRAIADALDLLPAGALEAALRRRLDSLLAAEIVLVVDDWRTKRPWFVKGDNPITNQWMLPTEGLVRACLVLGAEAQRDAYELGVHNALRALNAHGAAGEFEEGIGYAAYTVTSMLHTARAMAAAGDRRAIERPFLRNFPTWMAHHLQPGGMLINCFDAGSARAVGNLRPVLSLLAVCTGSAVARWALANSVGGPSEDLAGLLCRALPPVEVEAPPLFAAYERATRVNWRDSWENLASGVWVRGGHALDQHDHFDRGHVNFISRGRPILIEAGTPAYHNPRLNSHYSSAVGHNVLQVGEALPRKGVAPIAVARLDATGGDVIVDPTACYDGVSRWRRRVVWSAGELRVTDQVSLAPGHTDAILFRWHLGTTAEVSIAGSGKKSTVHWADAEMTLEGTAPLAVTHEMLPDNTLAERGWDETSPEPTHACILVRTAAPVGGMKLTTTVRP